MTLQNTIGQGVISKSEDGFLDYQGKIPRDFKEGERVSIIRKDDLDILLRVGIMPRVKEPITLGEADFPARLVEDKGKESEQAFIFDGYKYYMVNSIWVRYHPVESLD